MKNFSPNWTLSWLFSLALLPLTNGWVDTPSCHTLRWPRWSQHGVDFTNILQAAFAYADPKSAKRNWWLDCLFALLGSVRDKALRKHVGEFNMEKQWKVCFTKFSHKRLLRKKQFWKRYGKICFDKIEKTLKSQQAKNTCQLSCFQGKFVPKLLLTTMPSD